MTSLIAGAFGFLAAFASHDLAAQALNDAPLRPFNGTCPRCGTRRGWTKIRCPQCGRTQKREWIGALVGVLGALAFYNTVGTTWSLLAYGGFLVLSLALAFTDIDAMRIVDRLNIRGTAALAALLALGALGDGRIESLWRALLGAGAYFLATNAMFFIVRGRGFGYGDVKLSIQLGLFTTYISWGTLGWAVFGMALLGGVVSLVVIGMGLVERERSRRADKDGTPVGMRDVMRREVPYGPVMIAGAWVAIFLAGIGAFPVPT